MLCLLAGVLGAGPTLYAATPYVFSHGFDNASEKAQTPRGGTTRGAPVELDDTVPAAYHDIQAPGLDKRERDARAIRALAGDYRATFEFIETAALAPGIERDARPYRSWATERVFVIADTPTEIELQHIMVMRFIDDAGEISAPMVMKHWRQRWQWQPATIWRYDGDRLWHKHKLSDREAAGRWKQTGPRATACVPACPRSWFSIAPVTKANCAPSLTPLTSSCLAGCCCRRSVSHI